MVSDLFLTQDELNYLTGINKGKAGRTREERQIEQLKLMRVPYRVNARGAPIVARQAIHGTPSQSDKPASQWKSNAR